MNFIRYKLFQKNYISNTFELFRDNIINGNVSRDVFQSVTTYFHEVIDNENQDFSDEKEELIKFLILTEDYSEDQLQVDLDPDKIREDYKNDYDRIYLKCARIPRLLKVRMNCTK